MHNNLLSCCIYIFCWFNINNGVCWSEEWSNDAQLRWWWMQRAFDCLWIVSPLLMLNFVYAASAGGMRVMRWFSYLFPFIAERSTFCNTVGTKICNKRVLAAKNKLTKAEQQWNSKRREIWHSGRVVRWIILKSGRRQQRNIIWFSMSGVDSRSLSHSLLILLIRSYKYERDSW